jgi:hypothetical protein
MKVSQYIYTACGKDRNGAFSVFSKSKDITDEESSEIREVMMYIRPSGSGIPFEPSEQEIEELFPKKTGYFFLSSGRVCLAQVCYTGRVYSDLDSRWGNYIIHALVFKKTDNFAPYSFAEHSVFKRMLTKKEWHDDPIPDDYPQIEIPESGSMLSTEEITAFFNEDRKNKLKLLIEAVINSSNENTVHFFDDHKNHKYWLKILSLCLPKTAQNAVSFCTHFTNTLMPGNISSRVQIRVNRPDGPQFSYAQEAQKGCYAFDFTRNIIPDSVKPGEYAKSVVNLIPSGPFKTAMFVNDINNIMSTYSVNINEASDLINIKKPDFSYFGNADRIYNTIKIADRVNYETQSIANNLSAVMKQFNFNAQQKLGIFAFIYKNISDVNTKIGIIKDVMENAQQLGIRTDGALAFRDDLKSKANFIFDNYIDYLKAAGLAAYIAQNQNSFIKIFLIFDFLAGLPAVKAPLQARNYAASEEAAAVKGIMESAFKRQALQDLDLLLKSANSHANDLGTVLLYDIIKEWTGSGNRITNVQYAFDILQRLHQKNELAYPYLVMLVKIFSNQEEFIKKYISFQNNDPDFITKFEDKFKNESSIADFSKKKDMFSFKSQPLSLKALKEFFDKYYITGADSQTGLFIKRLGEYLNAAAPDKKVNECKNILDIAAKLPAGADKTLLPPVYGAVLETFFSIPYDKVCELYGKKEWPDKINDLYKEVKNAGVPLKQEADELFIITTCGQVLETYGSQDKKQVFEFFSKEQADMVNRLAANFEIIKSDKSIGTFIDYYFQPTANILISGAACDKQFNNYEDVIKRAFGKIFEKGNLDKLTDSIILGIKKSKAPPMLFILFIFRKHLSASPNIFDKKLGDIAIKYFEKISPGERKKTFSELLTLVESKEAEQFERFFEKFNEEHKSGFFGLFKKK